MNITEVLVPAQEVAWLPWAVQYFFYIGSAYAAAILFLIALIFKNSTSHQFRSALVLVTAIGGIVGPLALTGDLHQPGRAWHFYAHITPWSWMSLGSLFLPLFSGLAVATAWVYLRDDIAQLKHSENPLLKRLAWLTLGQWKVSGKMMVALAATTVLSGLSIALYTGAEIAVLASRPLWHQPASPLLWFTTAFFAAIGLTLLILVLLPSTKPNLTTTDIAIVQRTTTLVGALAIILTSIWASNHGEFNLYENHAWGINLGIMTLSILLCMVLAVPFSRLSQTKLGMTAVATVAIVSAWAVRWVTMMEVQTIPRIDVGPYPYELPMGSEGLLGIIGMCGLWLALALLASEIVSTKAGLPKSNTPSSLNHSHSL
ncbi:NrfD/PsrC family molybdoenzyme membrane anchor subunit [Vibrio superstes]|uniref:Tetrathionate reductase n=1 Tax=Vibrio superstes NBRC 103154 TaxID=1219062 RepID=A0A511QSH6_9VIBR|nr:NrfD/PsrC family molybdoenzyme membrane anchor subunit [Vibrio superstes]GEM79816.1 tetrathionate reductase [Vibrio superstes NBRC 103154]